MTEEQKQRLIGYKFPDSALVVADHLSGQLDIDGLIELMGEQYRQCGCGLPAVLAHCIIGTFLKGGRDDQS
jgi:hypothetical protein